MSLIREPLDLVFDAGMVTSVGGHNACECLRGRHTESVSSISERAEMSVMVDDAVTFSV